MIGYVTLGRSNRQLIRVVRNVKGVVRIRPNDPNKMLTKMNRIVESYIQI